MDGFLGLDRLKFKRGSILAHLQEYFVKLLIEAGCVAVFFLVDSCKSVVTLLVNNLALSGLAGLFGNGLGIQRV